MTRIGRWFGIGARPELSFKLLFARFRGILDNNTRILQLFADLAEKQGGEYVFDRAYIHAVAHQVSDLANKVVYDLNSLTDQKHTRLYSVLERLRAEIQGDLVGQPLVTTAELTIPFEQIDESLVNLVGGKSAHLGELRNRLQVPIPAGFTITTWAYLRVVEENGLGPLIEDVVARAGRGDETAGGEVAERLKTAKLPRDLRRSIARAVSAMARQAPDSLFLAVRSSALGEDQDLCFAGQYRTVLQTRPDEVVQAYRDVLASLYSPQAVACRRATGLPPRGLMAVACMRMIRARASGVIYTVDPNRPASGEMIVGATRGLASRAVQGDQSFSQFRVSRTPPHAVLDYRRAEVDRIVVASEAGGVESVAVSDQPGAARELSEPELRELAEVALRIERYFKQPQDIEWAVDLDGGLRIIQARRVIVSAPAVLPEALAAQLRQFPVLLQCRGLVACRGVAAGRVVRVADDADLDSFPSDGVLVSRRASPRFVRVMPRCAAIITAIGAPTGHMAALAREFRVPTIVDCGEATSALEDGVLVTVDADENVVYAGRVESLMNYQLVTESGFEDSPEYQLLRRLLRRVTPLNLVDPQADNFRADRCRTIHDVIRFAHEKAVEELITMQSSRRVSGIESARRLESALPLGLLIIDVGGGLDPQPAGGSSSTAVAPSAFRSLPMRAVWAGLTTPGVWSTQPVRVDFRTFISSAMSGVSHETAGRNLAVLSENYVNLSLNLGYHFNMIDAFVGDDREANHIYFRFVGGASDTTRRTRRATMVRLVLERLDFAVRQSGDLVVARLRKFQRVETEDRLRLIGCLVGFSRQVDALMDDEETVLRFAEAFLAGRYTFE